MATTLALAMRASMSASGVTAGANEAAKALDRIGKQAQQTARDVSVLKGIAIGAVLAKGASMAADAMMSAGRAIASYAAHAANAVDATNDLAQRLGINVEKLQALQMAAKLSGVDDITTALQKVTVAVGKATEGSEEQAKAFSNIGLSVQELAAMSPEEQFLAIQKAIAALPTPAERAAAAVALFGRSGVELLPLMNQNLKEVDARMRRLGAIVGEDQVEAIASMNDELDVVWKTFDGIIATVDGNLSPIVEEMATQFLSFVEEFNSANASSGGVAGVITNALLDVADYFAGIFDSTVAGFDGFGVTLTEAGAVFEFVGNIFTSVAEALRAGFNLFQIAGNVLAIGLGKFLEGIGSWVSSDLEQAGKDMAQRASEQADQNAREMEAAASNSANAAGRAIFGGNAAENGPEGPAGRAVDRARARMNDPEARAQRERERAQREADAKAAREAAAAKAKAEKDAADAKKRQEEAAQVEEKMAAKQGEIDKVNAERSAALGGKSNEALKANDIRSSEGISQYLALATGREDPAIEEYRKQSAKLEEIRKELRALAQEKVDILGAAA